MLLTVEYLSRFVATGRGAIRDLIIGNWSKGEMRLCCDNFSIKQSFNEITSSLWSRFHLITSFLVSTPF